LETVDSYIRGYYAQAAVDRTAEIVVPHGLVASHARQAEAGRMAKKMSAQEANWQAMFAPGGTPGSVIKSLNDALEDLLNAPEALKN
jgi:hypothetical protein